MKPRPQSIGHAAAAVLIAALLASCAPPRVPDTGANGVIEDGGADGRRPPARAEQDSAASSAADIPPPVTGVPRLPPPSPPAPVERYTVVVDDVPVSELLFALARDAELEIDIIGDIEGRVTLNATDATLPRLLERIALQAPIRYQLHDDYLRIAADTPYVVHYPVDYVNITRQASSSVSTATQVESTGFGEGGGGGGGSNNSNTTLVNESENHFWATLRRNLSGLLQVEAGDDESGGGPIMVNRAAGYVSVRATQRQHRLVRAYLNRVVASARRQVLIEATVVEVKLSDRYQAGVDWSRLDNGDGLDIIQDVTETVAGGATLTYSDNGGDANLESTIKLLDEFGDVRVVSRPKITALNNQMAILKVVDNHVYFTVDVESNINNNVVQTTYDTEVNTVPVGLVMTVVPYIGQDGEVLLNVRPTVSRILGFVNDPNPDLAKAGVENEIPEIQVREIESMLRVQSGQTAVIGGLMQNSVDRLVRSVPLLGDLPLIGGLFSYRDKTIAKTELIIFLTPTVVDEASMAGDFRRFRSFMPGPAASSARPAPGVWQ